MVRTPPSAPQLLAVYDRLLDRFMPPSFLVDEHGQLIDSYGGVETLLKVKARRPTQNLLDMLGDDAPDGRVWGCSIACARTPKASLSRR